MNAARDKMLAVVEKFDLPTADSLLAPLVEARTAVQALAAKAKETVRHATHITHTRPTPACGLRSHAWTLRSVQASSSDGDSSL